MTKARWLSGMVAGVLVVVAGPGLARADLATGHWPWQRKPPRPNPVLIKANQERIAEGEEPIRFDDQPRRTGPFRSCGSGLGLGLLGIGLAWGLMWIGTRHGGRIGGMRSTNPSRLPDA
jgi:hypothetical protein